jgi:hypothetical protein
LILTISQIIKNNEKFLQISIIYKFNKIVNDLKKAVLRNYFEIDYNIIGFLV